jgi:choline kinase
MAGQLSGAILAAGHGQRLRRASGGIPKALIELGRQPLLFRQIGLLAGVGASPIHVIVNFETYRLMGQRGLSPPAGVELLVRDTANSMESLLSLGEHITPGLFLLMTVDAVLYASDLRNFVAEATKIVANPKMRLDGALAMVKWGGDVRPLFVQIGGNGVITALGQSPSPAVTAGLYLLPTALFAHAAQARRRGLDAMRRFLSMLVEEGMRFAALEVPQAIDLDEAADLKAAQEMIAGQSS